MAEDNQEQISLPGGEAAAIEQGEGTAGTSGRGQGNTQAVTLAPIIIHNLRTDEPDFLFFLVEWGPDDGDDNNIMRTAVMGEKIPGSNVYVSYPCKLDDCIRGEWYRFRVSTVNKYGWKSITVPTPEAGPAADDPANYWVYQRAGLDEDDLVRLDEATNLLGNSDFEFDELEDGSWEMPYWSYWTGSEWVTCKDGLGPVRKGQYGRLTPYHLILSTGIIRSGMISIYPDRPYSLSGFFVQDRNGRADLTVRVAYYDTNDVFLDHDYVLMGEDGLRVINGSAWVGGGIFETRDRYGSVFFPPDDVAYGRVEIINAGTSDIWADDLMLSQTNKVTKYQSWDRESLESYADTWQYRRDIPPNGVIDFSGLTPIQAYQNEDASVDIKLRWNYTEGTRYTSGFMMFCNIANSGVFSPVPTLSDYDFAYKLANSGAKKYDLMGVNPLNRYSFSLVPYATTRGGISYGTRAYYDGGSNPPSAPDTVDWIDFQAASSVNLGQPPRTQVNILSEDSSQVVLEFEVTSDAGESATTYYRLTATGTFSQVVDVGGTQLTVLKNSRDVTVYYYSQGDDSGFKESVLEFVIDRNRTPRIVDVRSEFEVSTQEGKVYWYGDDDVERVDWDVDGGPTYITSGQSGNTGWFLIPAGTSKDVTMLPRGRGHVGTEVVATVQNPAQRPRVELKIVERRQNEIDVEYEAEGYGDGTVAVYSKTGLGAFTQVAGNPPAETIARDDSDVYLTYFGSGTTTKLLSNIHTFTIDYDRTAEISDTAVIYDYDNDEYTVKWWADDDTNRVNYRINSGLWYVVSGQAGQTTPQSLTVGTTADVSLVPYGPAGSGVAVHVYPTLYPVGVSLLPPYIVISGASNGSDGGGAYVLVDVFSFNSSGVAAGSIQYAEGNTVWSDAGTSNYQHKVYRPVTGETFARYRSYLGSLFSDTVVFNIDRDDLPEIRPDIDLSSDQTTVRIEWQGDDDVGSVEIIASGTAPRVYDLQAGVDEVTTIDYGETKSFTIQPFGSAGATGTEGQIWPLRITRPLSDSPWIAISKQAENTSTIPATITLQFDAESSATGVYWNASGTAYPGGTGWTSIANGGTQIFSRPVGNTSLVVRGYAANGTIYSTVASYTIDPDEVPSVTSAYYDPDWANDEAELYWSVDDDTDYVQLYLNGVASGSPIAVSTTHTTITGMVADTTKTYTIVPKRGGTEFPANAKTVVLYRAAASVLPTVQVQVGQSGSTGSLTLVINDEFGYTTGTSFEPVSGGTGSPNGDPASWSNFDGTDPYNAGDTVSLSGGHTSVIYWGVRYDLGDGNGNKWLTGSHTFDADAIPHVAFFSSKVDDSAYLSWVGDEDTASIRYVTDWTSMPDDTDLDSGTSVDGRVGNTLVVNGTWEVASTLYIRARGYSAVSGAGTAQEVDYQAVMRFEPDVTPTVKAIASQTGGGGALSLAIEDPHDVVTATAFEPLTIYDGFQPDSNPANWSNFDNTYPYNASDGVTLHNKHNSKIFWGVRYTLNSTNYWITGDHTFDANVLAEITGIVVSYESNNTVTVGVVGDEDCSNIYVTVGANSSPSDPTSSSYDGTVAGSAGVIGTSITAAMGSQVTVKARGYNYAGSPGSVRTMVFRRGDTTHQGVNFVPSPSQSGSTGYLALTATDPSGAVTNMEHYTSSGGGWYSTGWYSSSGNYGDASVSRTIDVDLVAKHTSTAQIRVTYTNLYGTSVTEVYGWTFDADIQAEVTNVSISFDTSGNIVVSASGDEDTASLHFRASGTGGNPGTPDGTASDDGSIAARSGTDTTSVTCAQGATAVVSIRGKNSSGDLGTVITQTAKREAAAPAVTGFSGSASKSGTSDVEYSSSWSVNSSVNDANYYIDLDFFENIGSGMTYVGSSVGNAPSDGSDSWTDTGAYDNSSSTHQVILTLRGPGGAIQSITSRTQSIAL